MKLCGWSKDLQDPDELCVTCLGGKKKDEKKSDDPESPDGTTVTCFGGKKKGRKKRNSYSDILVETEGLIRDLKQEVSDLRKGKSDETQRLDESVRRLMEEKEVLLEERLRVKEELAELRLQHRTVEHRADKLASENKDLGERTSDLHASVESARVEQKQTTEKTESLKRECDAMKNALLEANGQLKQTTEELAAVQKRYDASLAEVDTLTGQLSSLEENNFKREKELLHRFNVMKKKYQNLKSICRGKDVLISSLKEDRSKALTKLWHTIYGQKSHSAANLRNQQSPSTQLPLAAVQPYRSDITPFRPITSQIKVSETDCTSHKNCTGRLSPEFDENKAMVMEFELFRQGQITELFRDVPALPVEVSQVESEEADDESESRSEYKYSLHSCIKV